MNPTMGSTTGKVKAQDVFPTECCAIAPQEATDEVARAAVRDFIGSGFGHIALKSVSNARDLGGMPAADGRRIQKGRLFRSGMLADLSKKDAKWLQDVPLRWVIDLRMPFERAREPEPKKRLSFAEFEHLSVLSGSAVGITADEAPKSFLEELPSYESDAAAESMSFYPSILLSEVALRSWRRFFEILLATEEGAVLWHCSAGKDRTGLAAFLVELALGVPQDLVMEDYLASNRYTEPLMEEMLRAVGLTSIAPKTLEMIHVLFTVSARYLEAAVAAVLARYGTLDAYFDEALELDQDKRERLRELYLE